MARICCACFGFTCRQSFSSLALQLTTLRVSLRKLRMASSGISGNESGSGDSLLRFFAIRFGLCVANLSQARADSGAQYSIGRSAIREERDETRPKGKIIDASSASKIVRDVTERKMAEKALRTSEER